MPIDDEADKLYEEASKELTLCDTPEKAEAFRVKYLGRKGQVRSLFAKISGLPDHERPQAGEVLNRLKLRLESDLTWLIEKTTTSAPTVSQDLTLPGIKKSIGRTHPIYNTLEEMKDIFKNLGFDLAYGPEIESPYNNFTALNVGPDHPSIDETFYLEKDRLLRSHTSPVQIRTMLSRKPPFRIVAPGKVFRSDTIDPGHLPMFHQVEGLMVGKDVTFAKLKGVLMLFTRLMFGKNVKTRFRPSFFPYTEPSAEVDITCVICSGKGCSTCRHTGYLEILGSGMVHPNVFRNVGYDPDQVTGFAFGMGVERIAMIKYSITDIRLFIENHLQFLDQF